MTSLKIEATAKVIPEAEKTRIAHLQFLKCGNTGITNLTPGYKCLQWITRNGFFHHDEKYNLWLYDVITVEPFYAYGRKEKLIAVCPNCHEVIKRRRIIDSQKIPTPKPKEMDLRRTVLVKTGNKIIKSV